MVVRACLVAVLSTKSLQATQAQCIFNTYMVVTTGGFMTLVVVVLWTYTTLALIVLVLSVIPLIMMFTNVHQLEKNAMCLKVVDVVNKLK